MRVPPSLDLASSLVAAAEARRVEASRHLPETARAELGQFFTPSPVAEILVDLVDLKRPSIRVLDPGAGTGSLMASLVARVLAEAPETAIDITAVEIDEALVGPLTATLDDCKQLGQGRVTYRIVTADFITWAVDRSRSSLFAPADPLFNTVVTNPPYRKMRKGSPESRQLAGAGIETTNLYTGFLSLAQDLLEPGGQLVAITPRSFCNGTYFRSFRRRFLTQMALRAVHVFESRASAFAGDDVLQENVIFAAQKSAAVSPVRLSSSHSADDDLVVVREVPASEVVRPDDPDSFIHLVLDSCEAEIARQMETLPCRLPDLGLTVSTGRVVDFRAREYLRSEQSTDTVPLIYQGHIQAGRVSWPAHRFRKPQSIVKCPETQPLLLPTGHYVLTKRFTAKEEPRRVVAGTFIPAATSPEVVAFENHTNVFHVNGEGMALPIARGLTAFLNSTPVDRYFRQFSGHTQVNSGDLRALRYPSLDQLAALGSALPADCVTQQEIDRLVRLHVPALSNHEGEAILSTSTRIDEALSILKQLGFPRSQQNERSALTLLALCDLGPEDSWSSAQAPLRGITPMMDFFSERYGKTYKPNTRETVRRQTVHQFMAAGLVVQNPDRPDRPVNSPKATYQIDQAALSLVQVFGTPEWPSQLAEYLSTRQSLADRWAAERTMQRIPVQLPDGSEVTLSPGGQNVLIKELIDGFCSRFTPGGRILYVGDADEKWAVYDEAAFHELGLAFDEHGKMPDLVVHYPARDWLVLVEAVTSHGPVDGKRHAELRELFSSSSAGLVFVTAFLDRRSMARYLQEISWETEVWCADSPSHLIHFNGSRFLGPYEQK